MWGLHIIPMIYRLSVFHANRSVALGSISLSFSSIEGLVVVHAVVGNDDNTANLLLCQPKFHYRGVSHITTYSVIFDVSSIVVQSVRE